MNLPFIFKLVHPITTYAQVRKEAYGVVACLTPWNYPLLIALVSRSGCFEFSGIWA
jgi:hypothetical protein